MVNWELYNIILIVELKFRQTWVCPEILLIVETVCCRKLACPGFTGLKMFAKHTHRLHG